jgi:type IV fimbrial biogenesis protein FimT
VLQAQRVSNGARQVADLARGARARAMGRGSAMLLRWSAGAPGDSQESQQVTIREAIVGSGGGMYRPATSCFQTNWQGTSNSRFVGGVHLKAEKFQPSTAKFYDPKGTIRTFAEICFTPRGRTFIRYSAGGAFESLNGVPRIEIRHTETTRQRFVVLPPNGAARLVTRL